MSPTATAPAPDTTHPGTAPIDVTEDLIFAVSASTGLGFGIVSNVLFATRAHLTAAPTTTDEQPAA